MIDRVNTTGLRGLIYGLITICSMAVFGNAAEICDIAGFCPARLAAIIAFGVIATILGAVMCATMIFGISALLALEFIFSSVVMVLFCVCVGLTSSVRTSLGNTIALAFSWIALLLSFTAVFLSFHANGGLCGFGGKGRKTEDVENRGREVRDEETPEEEYMTTVGKMEDPESDESSKQTPMTAVEDENGN